MIETLKRLIVKCTEIPTYVVAKDRNEYGVDGRVVACIDRHSYLAEQYKVLRTNLYSLSHQIQLKTVVITSTQAQEGKSITASNLAYTLSLDSEKKTILVDCDLRKPTIYKLFGLSMEPGITDIVNGKVSLEELIEKPAVDDLYVITSGSLITNPSDFLNSRKMKELIEALKARFDYVIFDTPPVINVTDSSILGAMCDGVILVVRHGVASKDMIEEAFTMLNHAQAKPCACILTDVSMPFWYCYMSKYRYYYKYGYGRKDNEMKG